MNSTEKISAGVTGDSEQRGETQAPSLYPFQSVIATGYGATTAVVPPDGRVLELRIDAARLTAGLPPSGE
jgi:hypothetical protein